MKKYLYIIAFVVATILSGCEKEESAKLNLPEPSFEESYFWENESKQQIQKLKNRYYIVFADSDKTEIINKLKEAGGVFDDDFGIKIYSNASSPFELFRNTYCANLYLDISPLEITTNLIYCGGVYCPSTDNLSISPYSNMIQAHTHETDVDKILSAIDEKKHCVSYKSFGEQGLSFHIYCTINSGDYVEFAKSLYETGMFESVIPSIGYRSFEIY